MSAYVYVTYTSRHLVHGTLKAVFTLLPDRLSGIASQKRERWFRAMVEVKNGGFQPCSAAFDLDTQFVRDTVAQILQFLHRFIKLRALFGQFF